MRPEEVKVEFGITPSYNESAYHLAIIEKRSGKFTVYLDLGGIRFFQAEIIEAAEHSQGDDHGMIHAQGEHNFKLVAPRLTVIRLFIDYPRLVSPDKPPKVYRMSTGVLEMVITLADAKHLFNELARMADRASRGKKAKPIELPYEVSIEFIQDWEAKASNP